MSRHTKAKPQHRKSCKSRFEVETERRRREMIGNLSGRVFKVTHSWLRMFKPSTRRLALAEGTMGGARCVL